MVDGRPYYRHDFEVDEPKESWGELCGCQEMLRELGWEMEEPCCEHDCVTGFLIPYSKECDKDKDQITIPLELAEAALDDMISLKGEWHWWQDELRCNYQRDYNLLCDEIEQLEKLIDEHKNPGNLA